MSTPSPRTVLGPLTTTWTQPPVCSYAMAGCSTCTTAWYAQTCNQASDAHDWTDCWPPRASSITADPGVMMGWGLYSPGLVCPVGYTTVAKATAGGSSGWGIEYSMLSGETAIACCPTGYGITSVVATNTYAQTCITTATSTSFSTVQCDSGSFTDFALISLPASGTTSYIIYAPLIQLNYKESDLPKSTSTTSTASSSSSSTSASPLPTTFPSASSTTSSSSSSTTSSSSAAAGSTSSAATAGQTGSSGSSGGLSSGAKIGIGVGVAVGALALFIIAFLLFWLRRRRAREPPQVLEKNDPKKLPYPPQTELAANEVTELEATDEPQELATSPQHRGNTPPAQSIFHTSEGFPYLGGPPVFELEGDSAPSTPIRGDHATVSAASTPVRRDNGEIVSPSTPVRRSHDG